MMASRRALLAAMAAVATGCQRRPRARPRPVMPAGFPTISTCCPQLDVAVVGAAAPGGVALVFLHGYGRGPDEFVSRAKQLIARGPLTVFLPAGPLPHDRGGRAWWHFDQPWPGVAATGDEQGPAVETPPQLASARVGVQQLLRDIQKRHRPRATVLAGFSQGAMLAVDVAAAAHPPVDRVVAMSGSLLAASLPALRAPHPVRVPAFITHGRKDSGLPLSDGDLIATTLRRHGHQVIWRPFDDGHVLPPDDVFEELARFVLG
jgi:phospholipase/carboxylesterase